MRLHTCFEEEERGGFIVVSSYFFTLRIECLGHLIDKGYNIAEEFHHAVYTYVLTGTYKE